MIFDRDNGICNIKSWSIRSKFWILSFVNPLISSSSIVSLVYAFTLILLVYIIYCWTSWIFKHRILDNKIKGIEGVAVSILSLARSILLVEGVSLEIALLILFIMNIGFIYRRRNLISIKQNAF